MTQVTCEVAAAAMYGVQNVPSFRYAFGRVSCTPESVFPFYTSSEEFQRDLHSSSHAGTFPPHPLNILTWDVFQAPSDEIFSLWTTTYDNDLPVLVVIMLVSADK